MLYLIALFLHIAGALLLAAATGIEWLCIVNLRKVGTIENVRQSLSNYKKLGMIGGISWLLILIPGIYMMAMEWRRYSGWIAVAFIGIMIIAVVGGAVSSRKLRKAEKLLTNENALTSEVQGILTSGSLAFSLRLRTIVFLGIILLMVAKPVMPTSIIILAVSIAVGSLPIGGRARGTAAAQTEVEQ